MKAHGNNNRSIKMNLFLDLTNLSVYMDCSLDLFGEAYLAFYIFGGLV